MVNSESTQGRLRSSHHSSGSGTKQQRKATSLPAETVEYLKAWMMSPEHIAHPYPTETEKAAIMKDTGIEMKQLTNWFVNNRKRFWKPRVEAKLRDPHRTPLIKPDGTPLTLEDVIGDGPSATSSAANNTTSTTNQDRTPKRRSARRSSTTPVVSPPRIISEQNSVSSSSSYSSSSEEDEDITNDSTSATTTKTVKVHILRPNALGSDDLPELADVAVSEGTLFAPKNRILRTYDNCALTYEEGDLENQVERIKKHYLGVYLAERIMAVRVSDDESLSIETKPTACKKRKAESDSTTAKVPSRVKLHCVSPEDWKEACCAANNCYDDDALPSLEEASTLFGH